LSYLPLGGALASVTVFFIISRFFSLLNSLSNIYCITSFSFGVVSYRDLHSYIIDTVPSESPMAALS
jgi:hypothetical protein